MDDSTQVSDGGSNRRPLDALDRRIIDLLRADCQISNRSVARKLGVTEATAAARVNALVKGRYIRFALQRNLNTWGFRTLFFVEMTVRGRSLEDVCADLHEIPEVIIISRVAGMPQLIVAVRARSDAEVSDLTRKRLRAIAGVHRAEISVAMDTLKIASGVADLTDD